MKSVKGYSRADGVYVKQHMRAAGSIFVKKKPPVQYHPKLGENGEKITVKKPTIASGKDTWDDPKAVATFVPDGAVPSSLNGVALAPWRDHPKTAAGWDYVDGINDDIDEPEFFADKYKKAAAGVIIEEPDGRIWLIAPTNAFGGYTGSVPKGTAEDELSLQANAIKEAFEETGLKVEITGFIGDFDRTTSKVRMYRAKRTGGTPVQAGWETQGVHLAPKDKLYDYLNMWSDHTIAEYIGAGPAPKPKPKKKTATKGDWGNHPGSKTKSLF